MPLAFIENFIVTKCGKARSKIKALVLWLGDMGIFFFTLPLALFIRLDFSPPNEFLYLLFTKYLLVGAICYTVGSFLMKTYSTIIRLANFNTALRVSIASVIATISFFLITNPILNFERVPRSLFIIQMLLFIPLATLYRFSFRLFERVLKVFEGGIPTIIYGAGRTTNIFLPALLKSNSGIKIIGLIDDDRNKRRGEVQGVSVIGTGNDIEHLVKKHKIQQVIICMPALDGTELRALVARLRGLSVVVKIAPEANEFINSNRAPEEIRLRDIKIDDLLRRSPRKVNQESIAAMIKGRNVLVTGGGGSIGSELCRQILVMNPKLLIINDASEFSLYTITEELAALGSETKIVSYLADIAHQHTCTDIFSEYKIDLVFHAAAYKHVPLTEENVKSSLRNNIVGAYNLFEAAWKNSVKRVILVSSDKAVNPTNVMGATKRLCELTGLWFSQQNSSTIFSAVRFGNVLGSSGSVIPKFIKQIQEGGPVSITHPDITRYFMLIPEAVSLVLQASEASKSGDLYVLDMGQPIKIIDLARDLLSVMGLVEGVDIDIEATGLRPGEKMFEELSLGSEELVRITDDYFKVVKTGDISIHFYTRLKDLIGNLYNRTAEENRDLIFNLIANPNEVPENFRSFGAFEEEKILHQDREYRV